MFLGLDRCYLKTNNVLNLINCLRTYYNNYCNDPIYRNWCLTLFYTQLPLAVNQEYSTKAEDEYVIQGNDVLVKCKIPSFVADFVSVVGWIDDKLKPLDSNILNHYSTS